MTDLFEQLTSYADQLEADVTPFDFELDFDNADAPGEPSVHAAEGAPTTGPVATWIWVAGLAVVAVGILVAAILGLFGTGGEDDDPPVAETPALLETQEEPDNDPPAEDAPATSVAEPSPPAIEVIEEAPLTVDTVEEEPLTDDAGADAGTGDDDLVPTEQRIEITNPPGENPCANSQIEFINPPEGCVPEDQTSDTNTGVEEGEDSNTGTGEEPPNPTGEDCVWDIPEPPEYDSDQGLLDSFRGPTGQPELQCR